MTSGAGPVSRLRLTPAAGCAGSGRELARFGDLAALDAVVLGPIAVRREPSAPVRLAPSPAGVVHGPAPALPVDLVVRELLPWHRARGIDVVCALRGATPAALAEVAGVLRRSLDLSCVRAVEVDLTGARESARPPIAGVPQDEPWTALSADPQDCLRALARVREQLPRDVLLTAKLGTGCPDLVASARAAVGGGAGALLVTGSVPAERPGQWLSGPAVAPVTRGLVRALREAMTAGRLPQVPVLAVGGVHDLASAQALIAAGAAGLQIGTALLSDPWLLWQLAHDLTYPPDDPHEESR